VQELPAGDASAVGGDPDARGHGDERVGDVGGGAHDGAPGVDRGLDRGGGVDVVVDHQHEFVAAEACDEPHGSRAVVEPVGDFGEEFVAGVVAEGVVDGLELVEVDQGDRDRVAVAAGGGQVRHQGAAVRQAGGVVVGGFVVGGVQRAADPPQAR
jgi:hypothetical protein